MAKIVLKSLCGISLAALVVCAMCSCSMDAPENGIQIKVANKISSDEKDALVKILKGHDSGISMTSSMTVNDVTTINLSPVADVKAFTAKIKCGKITATNGNVITLDVDTAKLGLGGAKPEDPKPTE